MRLPPPKYRWRPFAGLAVVVGWLVLYGLVELLVFHGLVGSSTTCPPGSMYVSPFGCYVLETGEEVERVPLKSALVERLWNERMDEGRLVLFWLITGLYWVVVLLLVGSHS